MASINKLRENRPGKHTNSRGNPADRTFACKFFWAYSAAKRPPCPSYIAKCAHLKGNIRKPNQLAFAMHEINMLQHRVQSKQWPGPK